MFGNPPCIVKLFCIPSARRTFGNPLRGGSVKDTPKPTGRPPLAPGEGKKYPLAIRSTRELKAALVKASQTSGRSMAQEIEHRLEQSLYDQRHLGDALELGFGRQAAGLMLLIGCVIKPLLTRRPARGRVPGLSGHRAFAEMSEAINALLELLDPKGEPAWLRDLAKYEGPDAVETAVGTALPVAFPDDFDDDNPVWSPVIRAWLGDAMARLQKRLRPLLDGEQPRWAESE
jgi:hypothetical protein